MKASYIHVISALFIPIACAEAIALPTLPDAIHTPRVTTCLVTSQPARAARHRVLKKKSLLKKKNIRYTSRYQEKNRRLLRTKKTLRRRSLFSAFFSKFFGRSRKRLPIQCRSRAPFQTPSLKMTPTPSPVIKTPAPVAWHAAPATQQQREVEPARRAIAQAQAALRAIAEAQAQEARRVEAEAARRAIAEAQAALRAIAEAQAQEARRVEAEAARRAAAEAARRAAAEAEAEAEGAGAAGWTAAEERILRTHVEAARLTTDRARAREAAALAAWQAQPALAPELGTAEQAWIEDSAQAEAEAHNLHALEQILRMAQAARGLATAPFGTPAVAVALAPARGLATAPFGTPAVALAPARGLATAPFGTPAVALAPVLQSPLAYLEWISQTATALSQGNPLHARNEIQVLCTTLRQFGASYASSHSQHLEDLIRDAGSTQKAYEALEISLNSCAALFTKLGRQREQSRHIDIIGRRNENLLQQNMGHIYDTVKSLVDVVIKSEKKINESFTYGALSAEETRFLAQFSDAAATQNTSENPIIQFFCRAACEQLPCQQDYTFLETLLMKPFQDFIDSRGPWSREAAYIIQTDPDFQSAAQQSLEELKRRQPGVNERAPRLLPGAIEAYRRAEHDQEHAMATNVEKEICRARQRKAEVACAALRYYNMPITMRDFSSSTQELSELIWHQLSTHEPNPQDALELIIEAFYEMRVAHADVINPADILRVGISGALQGANGLELLADDAGWSCPAGTMDRLFNIFDSFENPAYDAVRLNKKIQWPALRAEVETQIYNFIVPFDQQISKDSSVFKHLSAAYRTTVLDHAKKTIATTRINNLEDFDPWEKWEERLQGIFMMLESD